MRQLKREVMLGTCYCYRQICGHADPMHFASDLEIADELFARIDRVELAETSGESEACD